MIPGMSQMMTKGAEHESQVDGERREERRGGEVEGEERRGGERRGEERRGRQRRGDSGC